MTDLPFPADIKRCRRKGETKRMPNATSGVTVIHVVAKAFLEF